MKTQIANFYIYSDVFPKSVSYSSEGLKINHTLLAKSYTYSNEVTKYVDAQKIIWYYFWHFLQQTRNIIKKRYHYNTA